MLLIKDVPFFRKPAPAATTTVVPLTLVAVAYEPGVAVELTFDRAIDIGAIDAQLITVDDAADTALTYDGGGGAATLVSPTTVRVLLSFTGGSVGAGIRLSAAAGNGIVAVDDGVTWAGATDLVIPFG